ncbi:MAG: M10 family metallopeptidase C-terminal domain-containing protein, partial [Methylococcales bacterium]|nr:M10 family metallopeptidase C-terminal domain-containing protein [Methylococcales bacterium]
MAASDDLTGSESLGGDWALEVNTGEINASLISEPLSYESTLAFGNGVTGARSIVTEHNRAENETTDNSIRSVLTLKKWGGEFGTGADLTYSFATSESDYAYPRTVVNYKTLAFNSNQRATAEAAMQKFSNIADISFTRTIDSSTNAGDIRWGESSYPSVAYTLYPWDYQSAGDIWIGTERSYFRDAAEPGSYTFLTFLHELGHAVGEDHTHSNITSPVKEDQLKYSIMSYKSYEGASSYEGNYHPTTPMLNDVAAMQLVYGENTTYHTGNDTYQWASDAHIFETIWDAGGIDTIDASNRTNTAEGGVSINLKPGRWSKIGKEFWNGQANVRDNLTIAYGAEIENATGTIFSDTLRGNNLNNVLTGLSGNDALKGYKGNDELIGGAGNDSLRGDAGDDILNGGTGTDTAIYLGNSSDYSFERSATELKVTSNSDGIDTLTNIETLSFSDGSIDISTIPITDSGTENNLPTGTVTISGIIKQGETLTVSNNLADADGLGTIHYQWKADGSNISGATTSTYTLAQAEVGKKISVVANYTDQLNTSESVSSTETINVVNVNDLPTGSVTLSGTVKQGETLTASNTLADVDGLGAISYQWKAGTTNIGTGETYQLTQAEVGKKISVTANYTDLLNTTESVSSTETINVIAPSINNNPTGVVSISGAVKQGETLTASNTLADADGLGVINYEWIAGTVLIGWGDTYKLTQAEVGKQISVTASYTDQLGKYETVDSNATDTVIDVPSTGNGITGTRSITTLHNRAEGATTDNSIRSVLTSTKWGGDLGTGADLTYSFATSQSVYAYPSSVMDQRTLAFNTNQQATAEAVMREFSSIADVNFTKTIDSSTNAGDIRWGESNLPSVGYTLYPWDYQSAGDIWIGTERSEFREVSEPGSYGFLTFLHEFGHSIGADHTHSNILSSVKDDQLKYSIMSYKSYEGTLKNHYEGEYYPTTPMLNDVAAMQLIYGENTTHHTENNTYQWAPDAHIFETIWDAGGIDTIDASNRNDAIEG